jgi:hypothetical protein
MRGFSHRIRIGLAGALVAALPGVALAQPTPTREPMPPSSAAQPKAPPSGPEQAAPPSGTEQAAPQGAPQGPPHTRAELQQRLLERYDTNHNGVLDKSERQQAERAMTDRELGRFDTDKSGSISRQEAEAHPNSFLARQFDKIDSNHDGVLSRQELTKANTDKLNTEMRGMRGKAKRKGTPQPS